MSGTRTFLDLENIVSASAAGCPPPTVEQYVQPRRYKSMRAHPRVAAYELRL
jgi:hypothetical protein